MLVSIIICTFNRSIYLQKCLDALFEQCDNSELYEIIIIDNNSNDITKEVVKNYTSKSNKFNYYFEGQQGLSYARNLGIEKASGKWICYLDDDAIPFPNYILTLLNILNIDDYSCFGGPGVLIYNSDPPKWFKDFDTFNYNENENLIDLPVNRYIDGFNCIFKKSELLNVGGFNPKLGMTGNKVAYGEETLIQIKIRRNNGKIGFCPKLKVFHLVDKYKLKLSWYFLSSYANGRDHWSTFDETPNFFVCVKLFLKSIIYILIGLVIFAPKLFKPNYYYQNYLIDSVASRVRNLGMAISGIKSLIGI